MHSHLAKPKQKIPVLPIIGLTNFSGSTDKALALTLKEKFSADNFCYFLLSKSKKPVWPRQQKCFKSLQMAFF